MITYFTPIIYTDYHGFDYCGIFMATITAIIEVFLYIVKCRWSLGVPHVTGLQNELLT
jgi:hypothetical protein